MADIETTSTSRVGSRGEFKTYHTTKKKDGKEVTENILEPFGKLKSGSDDDDAYALVIHRDYASEPVGGVNTTKLQVNSPFIIRAIREVVGSYPTVPSDFNSPFELTSPFQMLVHYWDELEVYRQETTDKVMRRDLNLLFDFMEHEIGPARRNILSMLRKEQITYLTAWVIYRPGDMLYLEHMGHGWLLRCIKTVYEESTKTGPYLEVHCTFTDHDGTSPCQSRRKITIYQKRQFGQENSAVITDLPVYPRRFVRDDDLEERLKKRGRKFLRSQGKEVKAYDGVAEYLKEPPYNFYDPDMAEWDAVWLPYTETGRIMLDKKTYLEDNYKEHVRLKLTDPELSLCPPYAMGYSLTKKQWCRFLLDNLGEVQWKENAWDSLILDEDQKDVVQAVVSSHRYPEAARNVPNLKGKGLVILLHGSPGSGKTLTAEASAEETRKALLSASLGDLNRFDVPWLFEMELKKVLQYATAWKAVVLLDEADVFLEARQEEASDTKRNALVAVFLKELEYFGGVVFLTTNRLKSFDLAMKSRVHLALEYMPPGDDVRRQIWTQYLEGVPVEERDVEDVDDLAETLAMIKLNGREIANAINTARTIARHKKSRLQASHIESVLKFKTAFDKKLQKDARTLSKVERVDTHQRGIVRQNSILSEEPGEF
ncbi:P-loop containing nucleoside triphosphate hydrolase protein [Hypomontagnella monticulosa]|nr:P-loop containing nucleoside triphosphate hydrolase protein [Hypomontagnella monticulosa]